jgi:hypothetical protein
LIRLAANRLAALSTPLTSTSILPGYGYTPSDTGATTRSNTTARVALPFSVFNTNPTAARPNLDSRQTIASTGGVLDDTSIPTEFYGRPIIDDAELSVPSARDRLALQVAIPYNTLPPAFTRAPGTYEPPGATSGSVTNDLSQYSSAWEVSAQQAPRTMSSTRTPTLPPGHYYAGQYPVCDSSGNRICAPYAGATLSLPDEGTPLYNPAHTPIPSPPNDAVRTTQLNTARVPIGFQPPLINGTQLLSRERSGPPSTSRRSQRDVVHEPQRYDAAGNPLQSRRLGES